MWIQYRRPCEQPKQVSGNDSASDVRTLVVDGAGSGSVEILFFRYILD